MGIKNKDGALYFATGIDNSGLKKDSEEAKRYLNNIAEYAKSAGAVLGVAFSVTALKQFGKEIITVRNQFQQLEIAFGTMLKSEDRAAKLMADLTKFAAETPFGLESAASGAKQLIAYGSAADDVISELTMLGDVAASTGQQIGELVYLYGTLRMQGRAYLMDIRQFAGRGIPIYKELANVLKINESQVNDFVSAGKVGFKEVEQAFRNMTSQGGLYGGLMEKQSESIGGRLEALKDNIDSIFNQIGKNNEGIIYKSIDGLNSLVENYEEIGRIILSLIATYGAYRAALAVVATAESGWTVAQMTKYRWLVLVEKAQKLLNATMLKNPYVLVATAIVGVVSAIIALKDRTTDAEKAQKRLNELLEEAKDRKEALKTQGNELITVLMSETATVYQQIKAYKELLAMLPQLKGKSFEEVKSMKPEEIQTLISERSDQVEVETVKERYEERIKNIEGYRKKIKELQKTGADDATISYYREELGKAIAETKAMKVQLDEFAQLQKEAFYQENPEAKRNDLQLRRTDLLQKEKELTEKIGKAQNDLESMNDRLQLNAVKSQIKGIDQELSSLNKSTETATVKNHAYWEKYKDDAEEALKALGVDQEGSEKWVELTKKIKTANDELKKYSDKDSSVAQSNQTGDAQRKLADLRKKNTIDEKRLIEDIENDVRQAEINAMNDGFNKTMAQRELNHQIEIQNLKRQKEDYINQIIQARKEEFEAEEDVKAKSNKGYVKRSFDGSTVNVDASAYDTIISQKNTQYMNETKKAWNDLALEFGDYYQKRLAIAEKWEKQIAELPAEFQAGARIKMNAELAGLDDEYRKTTTAITELFKDTSEKTPDELRKIADEAERMKDFVLGGQWDENKGEEFKISEAKFKSLNEEWSKSPEKLEAIIKAIIGVKREADLKENAFKVISSSIDAIFNSKTSGTNRKRALKDLANSIEEVNDLAQSVGGNISSIFSAFGKEDEADMAGNITQLVGGIGEAGTGIAQLYSGDIIGGVKNLASGIKNVVSSIIAMGDASKEKRIQQLQAQIDVLKKSYDELGRSIEKAYSKDASNLIEQQNVLLKQQQIAIRQQIKEEESKKKTDKNKIKEWKRELEEIDNLIEENKIKAVDAIYGEEIQSAIERFAQAYVDMWAAGDDKAKSRKDFVKDLIKRMILEAMKADIKTPMEAIREKLKAFWADDRITDYEESVIDGMVENLQNQLDRKYSWADKYFQDATSSSGVTGELKAEMTEQTGSQLVGLWNMTAMDIRQIREFFEKNPTVNIEKEINSILNELQSIKNNTGRTADNTDSLDENIKNLSVLLEEIKKNTKPNNSRI